MPITLKKKNFSKSTLASGITDSAASLSVAAGEGAKFPQAGKFRAVVWGASYLNPWADPSAEVVEAELSSGDAFVIARAKESTLARAWAAGDHIAHALTAGTMEEVEEAVNAGEMNTMLNAFRIAVVGSLSVQKMVDGVVDEFEDTTGVDMAASTGKGYDPESDLFQNALTRLLLHANGADGQGWLVDSSPFAHNMLMSGNLQLDTAQQKFGTASLLFDGAGDYTAISTQLSNFAFGSGDFTLDFWVRFAALPASGNYMTFYSRGNNGGGHTLDIWNDAGTYKLRFVPYIGGAQAFAKTWAGVTTGVWYHLAFVRSGTSWYVFVDGVQLGTTDTKSGALDASVNNPTFGRDPFNAARDFNGWLDEFRVSKGVARWTSNFTPPSAEYSGSAEDMVLVSTAQAAVLQPSSARVVVFEEDVDSVTINADLKAWASRDGGATWAQVALADEGYYETGKRILSGAADISGQPSGASMKWKLTTHNAKRLNVHGAALAWK